MTAFAPPVVSEALRPGSLPFYDLPTWRAHGVVAGITGRGTEPGRGFDLGLWSDAPIGQVMSRWLAFRRAQQGFDAVVLGNQVHGTVIETVGPSRGWIQLEGVDGWVTTSSGVLLTVTVADCIPVYLLVPRRGVALLHAGWRGTAGGILTAGLARLTAATGSAPGDVIMHLGVGICGPCYEVGSEVMTGCGVAAQGPGPWHLDLRERLAAEGRQLGIEQISTSGWCSAHDRASFYSHRASRGADGRMVAYLGVPRSD
ncbi:MAG TPA: polyphenol oxidase family protein [Gemmatimonadales bacterium]|nr:polyphenol oxidase family protein [Gemmatimonadales bacterium]